MIRTSRILTTLAAAAALTCGGTAMAQGGGSGAPSNNTQNSGPKAGSTGTSPSTMNRNSGTSVVTPQQGANNPSPAGPNGVGTTGPIDRSTNTGTMNNNNGTMANTDTTPRTRHMRRRAPRADRS